MHKQAVFIQILLSCAGVGIFATLLGSREGQAWPCPYYFKRKVQWMLPWWSVGCQFEGDTEIQLCLTLELMSELSLLSHVNWKYASQGPRNF